MFLTFDGLEGQVPAQAHGAGFQFWTATVLPKPVPWYLLSVLRREARQETVFVASESTLIDLLGELDSSMMVGLMRFDFEGGACGAWKVSQVAEVWCDWMLEEGRRLLFKLPTERTLRDAGFEPTRFERRGCLIGSFPKPHKA